MKCGACGAINGSSTQECDFCQTNLYAAASPGVQAQVGASLAAAPQVTFVKDAVKLIEELNKTPSRGFNIWAFLFPIGYLAGYNADDNAKKVATVILIPTFILSMLMYVSDAFLFSIVFYAWALFVSYLIATRTQSLARVGTPFSLGRAAGFHTVYLLLYYFILAL